MDKLPWIFVVCFGCLSVYNFLQNREVNLRVLQLHEHQDQGANRYRRDASTKDGDDEDLKRFMLNFPAEKICKKFMYVCAKDKCKQEETAVIKTKESNKGGKPQECIRGPPGPPGPGLEFPKLVKSTLHNDEVNISNSKTFECTFYGNPIPTVTWRSPAKNFSISSTIDKQKLEVTSRFVISNVSWDEQGPIVCHAKSLLGEAGDAGNLTVLTKPVILNHQNLVFTPEGITFDFPKCKVRSNPPAKITWKRIFWSMPAGRFSTKRNNLLINNVQFKDEGFYVCEAENFLGKDKATTQLKVSALEIHESSPQSITINHGETANINCSAFRNAKKMNGRISSKTGSKVQYFVERAPSGNSILLQAVVNQEGIYSCEIQNEAGKKVRTSVFVEIRQVPTTMTSSTKISTVKCMNYEFRCHRSNRCIHRSWKCDGALDCPNGEDEDPAIC
ncbi:protein sax-3-like [Clytia hemisphaerica]|uniref:Ig-like domain-containing protein n=1 Tax=Clytia hemisphaerica TaxID=252671 RepID=A0A7M5X9I5_9CNID